MTSKVALQFKFRSMSMSTSTLTDQHVRQAKPGRGEWMKN
jgi:hypothetical protein